MSQAVVRDNSTTDQFRLSPSWGSPRRLVSGRRCRFAFCLLLTLCGSLLVSPLTLPGATSGVDVIDDESPVEITLFECEPAFPPGHDRGPAPLKLALQLRIRNRSPRAMQIQREQFSLLVNANAAAAAPGSTSLDFRTVTLEPGQEASGALGFSDIDCSAGEPALVLKWLMDDQFALIDLNQQLRTLCTFHELRLGANDALLMLSTRRNLDILAVWVLQDLLLRRSREGIQRIVLCPEGGSDLQLTDDASAWLATASNGSLQNSQPPLMFPPCPVQFLEVHVGGFGR